MPNLEIPPSRPGPEPKTPEPEISPPKSPHIDLPEPPQTPQDPVPVKGGLRLVSASPATVATNLSVATLAILGFSFLIRLVIAATLGLTDDEAWYWGLSQNLQTAYHVHPPLGIWLIRLSTALFGTSTLAVRLPAIFCSTLATYWLLDLVRRMGWGRGAPALAALFLITPFWFLGGVLSGPDQPLFAAWAAMMNLTYRMGMGYDRTLRTWTLLGLALGLALASKFTALLAPVAGLLWLVTTRHGRRALFARGYHPSRGAAWACVLAVLFFAPVLAWNAHADWSSFREQLFDRHSNWSLEPKRWLLFAVSQLALFGPALFYAFAKLTHETFATNAWDKKNQLNLRFLLIWSLVTGVPFFIQPLVAPFKIHWTLLAYVPVCLYFARLTTQAPLGSMKTLTHTVAASIAITLVGATSLYWPVLGWAGLDFRQDFSNEFYGWKDFEQRLHDLPEGLRDLPLVASRYQPAAQAAFALSSSQHPVKILPYTRFSEDWGGDAQTPARFLFVSDTRFSDDPSAAFGAHRCQPVATFESQRLGFTAKQIRLLLCERR